MYQDEYFSFFSSMFSFLDEDDNTNGKQNDTKYTSLTNSVKKAIHYKPLNCVFDLDNTLVCAVPFNQLYIIPQHIQSFFKYIDYVTDESNINSVLNYRIFIRPYFIEMITEISSFCNISIWTAATREYANFIFNTIFPINIKVNFILDREHTEYCVSKFNKFKPLEYIYTFAPQYTTQEYNKCNTIIVDDLIDVASSNPFNCIQIKPFKMITDYLQKHNATSVLDKSLLHLIQQMKQIELKYYQNNNCV
jgi:hypothetical protein